MAVLNYLDNILGMIKSVASKSGTFNEQMANVLRLYYIGLNHIFITQEVLKKVPLSSVQLSGNEKTHVENAGWLLDKKYIDEVYMPALKTDLIFNAWLVFNAKKVGSEGANKFKGDFQVLIDSLFNDTVATGDVGIDLGDDKLTLVKDEKVGSVTPEIALKLVQKLIDEFAK